jgi:hypothetical protein
MKKYHLPNFLKGILAQDTYDRWLHRKAVAHVRRDRRRGNDTATISEYKMAIHKAVENSRGKDAYTNEELDWLLLSRYDNAESRKSGRAYKKKFALLPSVDHVRVGKGAADFKICAWRTNDSKNDLSYEEFLKFCEKVIKATHLTGASNHASAASSSLKR